MAKKDAVIEESTIIPAQTVLYYFPCACGCGQLSDELGKEYIKLRKNQKWYKKGCETGKETVQEFRGGFIVNESDF